MIKHPQQHLEIISMFNFLIIQSTYYKESDSVYHLIRLTSALFVVTLFTLVQNCLILFLLVELFVFSITPQICSFFKSLIGSRTHTLCIFLRFKFGMQHCTVLSLPVLSKTTYPLGVISFTIDS